ncbi:MAG: TonB-dependent receptor [Bacteroidetes bacterium]|nr:TonB-dependent receptor [Bacteroidota bacterium]
MAKNLLLIFTLFQLFGNSIVSFSQNYSQTIRGTITDYDTKEVLIGATFVILNQDPFIGASSDINGKFKIEKVPFGRYNIKVTYIGYQDYSIKELEVGAGKEIILNIELHQKLYLGKEIEIKANKHKENSVNEMTTVSSRTFSVEETNKYAGSWGDPSRMASNYAGVTIVSDKRNDIIVRGNSPIGVLWRLDGISIPNPNHFSIAGSSGGAISMINSNLLDNSDFLTGAFAAEYGNAISAVFDLKMRNGNNEKREYIAQLGVNGFELGAEGPFIKGKPASYLINYRYSTLGVLDLMGISIIDAVPQFQDISFKLNFPIKKSIISVFGIGGKSSALYEPEADSTKWKNIEDRYGYLSGSKMGIAGISLMQFLNKKNYLKITLSGSLNNAFFRDDSTGTDYHIYENKKLNTIETNYSFSAFVNTKLTPRNLFRYGIIFKNMNVENEMYLMSYFPTENKHLINNFAGNANLAQAYIQWRFNLNEKITINSGIHYLYLLLNNKNSIEPRAAIKWSITSTQTLSFGFGIHGQIQPLATYFTQAKDSSGNESLPNKDLDFTKSQQFVLGYDWLILENLRLKLELYYQNIYNVPIDIAKPTNSLINFGTDDNIFSESAYANSGKGKNYGAEITLEKFFSKNYYFLITGSLLNSKYVDGNKMERNTRYNCNHAFNFLAGKEFIISKRKSNSLGINFGIIDIGGQHYTPIDLIASQTAGRTIYIDSLAYSKQFKDFIKVDIRLSYKKNGKKVSHEIAVEINNVFNRQNIESQFYNANKKEIQYTYQLERIPIVLYRLKF